MYRHVPCSCLSLRWSAIERPKARRTKTTTIRNKKNLSTQNFSQARKNLGIIQATFIVENIQNTIKYNDGVAAHSNSVRFTGEKWRHHQNWNRRLQELHQQECRYHTRLAQCRYHNSQACQFIEIKWACRKWVIFEQDGMTKFEILSGHKGDNVHVSVMNMSHWETKTLLGYLFAGDLTYIAWCVEFNPASWQKCNNAWWSLLVKLVAAACTASTVHLVAAWGAVLNSMLLLSEATSAFSFLSTAFLE